MLDEAQLPMSRPNFKMNMKKRVLSAPYNMTPHVPVDIPKDRRFKDMSGSGFGRLLVLGYLGKTKYRDSMWLCHCRCGKKSVVRGGDLGRKVVSCGCHAAEKRVEIKGPRKSRPVGSIWVPQIHPSDNKFKDLSGKKFNKLEVIGYSGRGLHSRSSVWLCLCDCGEKTLVNCTQLANGAVKSCGCLHAEVMRERTGEKSPNYIHGASSESWYSCYTAMVQRCTNPMRPAYKYYGGAGIAVCKEWLEDPLAFSEHIGPRPDRNHSIDRHPDRFGNYEPGNVRWATRSEQAQNQTTTKLNAEIVLQIRAMRKEGIPWAEVQKSVDVNCSLSSIKQAAYGCTWKNIAH